MGAEDRLLISPRSYRRSIKPRHAELFQTQQKLFPQPFYCFLHSDGAIYPLLRDFIEIGVQVLNPLQLSAEGMDGPALKREFGRDLVFWGGAIDPEPLATWTPDQVQAEVGQRIAELSPDGGYIFGGIHNIQDDAPPENVMALVQAWRELRDYEGWTRCQ